jgi:hypothetical protein
MSETTKPPLEKSDLEKARQELARKKKELQNRPLPKIEESLPQPVTKPASKKWLFWIIFIALGAITVVVALYLFPTLDLNSKSNGNKNPKPIEANEMLTNSRDGKTYKTVKISKQTWMAENLGVETGNSVCYDNDESKCQECGRLYDWNTAMKACPKGWHLPSKEEWAALGNAAGGVELKHVFSVLFCGRYYNGKFLYHGLLAQFWSATESDANYAWGIGFDAREANMDMGNLNKSLYLRSVRCVRD